MLGTWVPQDQWPDPGTAGFYLARRPQLLNQDRRGIFLGHHDHHVTTTSQGVP